MSDAVQEVVHGFLALGQLCLAVLLPEAVVLHTGIGVNLGLLTTFEEFVGYRVEGIVGQARCPDGHTLLQEVVDDHLHDHIVNGQHPLTSRQLGKLLHQFQVFHEVDVRLVRQNQFATFHLIGRVFQDIQVATETEVLLVVGQEVDVDAAVTVYLQRIFDIVAIERDSPRAYRRREGMLQDAYLVVVDIHVGEDVLRHGIQDVARLKEIVDT